MTTYAIGDLQGCLEPLKRLLDRIEFDPDCDRLWFVGDLVNRGPDSLETLRFVKSLGASAVTVLGNHDLHLLAIAAGNHARLNEDLKRVIEAPDAPDLLEWLRRRPLLQRDAGLGWTMVHGGLPPQWDVPQAVMMAAEMETVLAGANCGTFLADMYGDTPHTWSETLEGIDRLRYIVNAFTRTRFVFDDGRLDFDEKGPPGSQPEHLVPWFEHPDRRSRDERIVFGHWSALGAYHADNVWGLDSGCVWGNELTAIALEEPDRFISVPCPDRV